MLIVKACNFQCKGSCKPAGVWRHQAPCEKVQGSGPVLPEILIQRLWDRPGVMTSAPGDSEVGGLANTVRKALLFLHQRLR